MRANKLASEKEVDGLGLNQIVDRTVAHLENCRALGVQELPKMSVQTASYQPPTPSFLELQKIRQELGACTRCKLHQMGRNNIVFGVGNPDAELMFIGEAPGRDEDLKAEPFVGRAGKLLNKIIEAIDMKRSDVYIANVIKCRPPQNRNPEPDELAPCRPFWQNQIMAVSPKVLVTLGSIASRTVLQTETTIGKLRGSFHEFRGIALMPTYHPAYLLRNPAMKRQTWDDMKKVRDFLNKGEC